MCVPRGNKKRRGREWEAIRGLLAIGSLKANRDIVVGFATCGLMLFSNYCMDMQVCAFPPPFPPKKKHSYEPRTRSQTHAPLRTQGPVYCVAFSNGRAVSGGQDGQVRVWDLQTGEALLVLGEPRGSIVTSLCAVGDMLAVCTYNKVVRCAFVCTVGRGVCAYNKVVRGVYVCTVGRSVCASLACHEGVCEACFVFVRVCGVCAAYERVGRVQVQASKKVSIRF